MKKWIARAVLVSALLALYGCVCWMLPFWSDVENPWEIVLMIHAIIVGALGVAFALRWASRNSGW